MRILLCAGLTCGSTRKTVDLHVELVSDASGSVEAFAVLLLDQVEEDCTENQEFERNLLEAKHKAQAEAVLVR
jgi:hypothetical protein